MDLDLKLLHTSNTTLTATNQIQNIIYRIRHPSLNRGGNEQVHHSQRADSFFFLNPKNVCFGFII